MAVSISIVTRGMNWKRVKAEAEAGSRDGLLDGLQILKDESVRRTPLKTGHLRESAQIVLQNDKKGTVEYNADYAIYVHEILEARHPIGSAKFLELAMKDPATRTRILAAMARKVNNRIS